MAVFLQKERIFPCAHKIGAAISGPRIAGKQFYRHEDFSETTVRSRPGKPNQRKGHNEKFMNFALFCEFWWFFLGKQARFTWNFCSGMPLWKVHELTFLWFGLPGPLLKLQHFVCNGRTGLCVEVWGFGPNLLTCTPAPMLLFGCCCCCCCCCCCVPRLGWHICRKTHSISYLHPETNKLEATQVTKANVNYNGNQTLQRAGQH